MHNENESTIQMDRDAHVFEIWGSGRKVLNREGDIQNKTTKKWTTQTIYGEMYVCVFTHVNASKQSHVCYICLSTILLIYSSYFYVFVCCVCLFVLFCSIIHLCLFYICLSLSIYIIYLSALSSLSLSPLSLCIYISVSLPLFVSLPFIISICLMLLFVSQLFVCIAIIYLNSLPTFLPHSECCMCSARAPTNDMCAYANHNTFHIC